MTPILKKGRTIAVEHEVQILTARWVFTQKIAILCRARLVVRDYASGAESAFRSGIYAPTSSLDSLRVVLAFSVVESMSLLTADVSTAFMYAPVEADACDLVLLPANITVKGQRVILWLKKAMNGLRRAPLLWFLELQRTIRDLGGDETFESTLFRVKTDAQFLLVLVYVDDLLIASNDVEGGENFLRALQKIWKIKRTGSIPSGKKGLEIVSGEEPAPAGAGGLNEAAGGTPSPKASEPAGPPASPSTAMGGGEPNKTGRTVSGPLMVDLELLEVPLDSLLALNMGAAEPSDDLVSNTCFEVSETESERWHRAAHDAQEMVYAMQSEMDRVVRTHQENPGTELDETRLPDGSGPRSGMSHHELGIRHMQNWQSAEADLDLTRELAQEEIDKGWVFEFPGDLSQAQAAYPTGVSVGKLGVATSDTRPPRLVVDSSICGLNSRCKIPEKSTLPTAKDVLQCFPLRHSSASMMGLSLDIKSAHKRIVLRESEWGLVGFSLDGKLFFYRVCPFGAIFSAAWWSRLGGWILRCMHHMLWLPHAAFLYVDDFLFFQDRDLTPISAAMLCILCQILKIPISWRKCELSGTISWFGWRFHFAAGFVEIPADKLEKIRKYLRELASTHKPSRKLLEKFIGLAMWLTQLFPYMRIWLHYLYKDLYSIPASHYSKDPVKHQPVTTLDDVRTLHLSDRRIRMRVRDPDSSRRRISTDSHRIITLFSDWLSVLSPVRPLVPKPLWQGEAAADACASGSECQIGGFVRTPDGRTYWFSERLTKTDFDSQKIPIASDLQRNTTCFETLAQMALLFLVSRSFPGFRLPLRVQTLSDNTGAEFPQCLFVEKLCLLAVALARKWMSPTSPEQTMKRQML